MRLDRMTAPDSLCEQLPAETTLTILVVLLAHLGVEIPVVPLDDVDKHEISQSNRVDTSHHRVVDGGRPFDPVLSFFVQAEVVTEGVRNEIRGEPETRDAADTADIVFIGTAPKARNQSPVRRHQVGQFDLVHKLSHHQALQRIADSRGPSTVC
jgi:hypothetical protein